MYKEIAKLIMYGNMKEDTILVKLGEIFRAFDEKTEDNAQLIRDIYTQLKRLLEVATDYGFDHNLWHNYLTYLLITNENPFSLTCEKVGANDGSVNIFAKNDFRVFRNLFFFDFKPIEEALGIQCFSILSDYKAIGKKELMYNKNVSEKVQALSEKLEQTKDENEFFEAVTDFYKAYGVGMFGLNKAFRLIDKGQGEPDFYPINNLDKVMLDDLVGYEIQKKKLVDNTEAFVQGRKANNVLLFGDSGTGKSTSIKAIVNQYYDQGLRMIEIYKHQFKDLSGVIARIKNRNYRFIIYMDDLSFEEFEIEYKFLKAVIEGGVETKPENILIYATSNRRHLIREKFNKPGMFDIIMEENTPNLLEQVDPKKLIEHKEEIAAIINEIPTSEELIAMINKVEGVKSLEDLGFDESYQAKTAELSPYVRARITFMRLLKFYDFYEEVISC